MYQLDDAIRTWWRHQDIYTFMFVVVMVFLCVCENNHIAASRDACAQMVTSLNEYMMSEPQICSNLGFESMSVGYFYTRMWNRVLFYIGPYLYSSTFVCKCFCLKRDFLSIVQSFTWKWRLFVLWHLIVFLPCHFKELISIYVIE